MDRIMNIATAVIIAFVLCITVSAQPQIEITGQTQAIVGEILPLEVKIPAQGYSKVECTISTDDTQMQLQKLPEANGWDMEFQGMTLVMTRQEGKAEDIFLKMKWKVLPVPAQTKVTVSFRFATDGNDLGTAVYEITVVEPASHENFLTELSVEGGALTPQFHPDILQYSAAVPADCQQPKVHAVGAQKSRVEISQTEFSQEGTCAVTVVVTAENGSQRSYTIRVTREEPAQTEPETTELTQPASQETQQPPKDSPVNSAKEGVPGWLVAAAILAGAAIGGAGGILLSQKKDKDR